MSGRGRGNARETRAAQRANVADEQEAQGANAQLQEEVTNLRNQVQQLLNQVQQQQQVQPVVPPQTQFAFSPAQLHTGDNLIDYSTKSGMAIFDTATAPLSDEKFDGTKGKLPAFKADVQARATISGWDSQGSDVMHIPSENNPNVKFHIIEDHPLLTEQRIITWARTSFVGQQNRMSQNNFNMFTAIDKSIQSNFKSAHLLHDESKYTVDGTKVAALYLLLIFTKCEVGTTASISVLRSQLQDLSKSLKDNGQNIKEFHADVKTKITKLKSYGEEVNDLVHNLFKAYLTAKDSEFTRAIKDERRDFLLGKKNITAEELMVFAETLYSLMVEEDSWGTHQDQEEQIVALTTEIRLLKSQAASKSKNPKKRNKGKDKDTTKEEENSQQEQGGVYKKKSKQVEYAEWMLKAPTGGQAKTKTVNEKQYWWCPHHQGGKGQWVRHKPEDHKDTKRKSKSANEDKTPRADVNAAIAEFLE